MLRYKNFTAFISIHALLAESDKELHIFGKKSQYFYPRSPCGERLAKIRRGKAGSQFLSTLSLRRATASLYYYMDGTFISIHALLAESDSAFDVLAVSALLISIHALLAESDYDTSSLMQCQAKFLSTLSLRRATAPWSARLAPCFNFYPRSPCGERLENALRQIVDRRISIHALLAESDVGQNRLRQKLAISIHALLAESDKINTK